MKISGPARDWFESLSSKLTDRNFSVGGFEATEFIKLALFINMSRTCGSSSVFWKSNTPKEAKECCVYGCEHNSRDYGLTAYSFPHKHDLERAKQWLDLCKIEYEDIKKFNFKGLLICGRHFAEEAFEDHSDLNSSLNGDFDHEHSYSSNHCKLQKRLKPDAVPTLHIPACARLKMLAKKIEQQKDRTEKIKLKRTSSLGTKRVRVN